MEIPYNKIKAMLELLKEYQANAKADERFKALPPVVTHNAYGWLFYHCPTCKREFFGNNKAQFCDKCGQAILWE